MELRGLEERCELLHRGRGRSTGRRCILGHFGAPETISGDVKFRVLALRKKIKQHILLGPLNPRASRIVGPAGSVVTTLGGSLTLSGSGKQFFNRILDPDADPDHHQNLITFFDGPSPTFPKNFSCICL